MSDREIWMLVFLAWLFGSITLSCVADKFIQRIKNRRPRSAKRKAAQRKNGLEELGVVLTQNS